MLLVIGDKNFSSWSLRPWLLMQYFQIPFEEKLIRIHRPDSEKNILKYSPSSRVPCLIDTQKDLTVWDSLAIMEYLNEEYPEKNMWPKSSLDRALARSISAEMHSSFLNLRETLPHDLKKKVTTHDFSRAQKDIERITLIWEASLNKSGGPFLFGHFTIADAMYAPVVNRFVTYNVPTQGTITTYIETIRSLPAMKQWIEAALKED